jgi:hypothetical protein
MNPPGLEDWQCLRLVVALARDFAVAVPGAVVGVVIAEIVKLRWYLSRPPPARPSSG